MSNVGNTLPPMASERQALITIEAIDGDYWATIDAIAKTAAGTLVFDGGATIPEILLANAEVAKANIGRPFRPGRDAALLPTLLAQVGVLYLTANIQYTDGNLSPVGPPLAATGYLTGVTNPQVAAGSGTGQNLVVEITIDNIT